MSCSVQAAASVQVQACRPAKPMMGLELAHASSLEQVAVHSHQAMTMHLSSGVLAVSKPTVMAYLTSSISGVRK